ncbi:intermembrane lipid transfer protein VPS13B [Garra rufa]|uniref:intermembrane lipid transfer protein VPS13B n=2 Tax=Garra rufa TaxID=137080 RepID=UPI003CCEBA9B
MLESYVSPLLMSYVNRYIKNLKPSDLQLSLWGGDVVLSKLDLRLDVLEQELKLPFTFLSGHIHELRIHVPWTKLSSEPVVITINTMECILKLRDGATDDNESCTSSSTNRSASESSKAASKPRRVQQAPSDPDLPPGYVQSLIRRVVNNVNIVVNNLILKYVEDDIVLSVNITSAECYTVDDLWDRAFMDIIAPELVLRKVINFSDCTVCLDKRNASGKIEFYQDPLLYKCSFRTRLHFTYDNINAKIPAVIKVHTMVESLKLSLTDQQLPMFIRLMELGVALYYGEMGVHRDPEKEESGSLRESVPGLMDTSDPSLAGQYFQGEDEDQGWMSWAWSFVPAIVSTEEEEGEGESGFYTDSQDSGAARPLQNSPRDPVVSVGFYCTKASVTFKLTESCSESSYYSPQKVKSREVLSVEQEGITVEALMMGEPFFDCQVGVVGCHAVCLKGIMGVRDFEENMNRKEEDAVFFRCGDTLSVKGMTYLTNSLFDYRSPENNGVRAEFILDGNLHRETYTENAGLQRYGAFYMDYLYTMENSSRVCVGLQDFPALRKDEPPLVQETSVKRIVVGPLDVQLHSSAVHRILKMAACTLDHEYQPYCKPQTDVVEERVSVVPEQVSALEEFIPIRQTSVTLMRATVTVPAAEYNLLHLLLPVLLGHKVSTAQTSVPQFQLLRPLPALQLQFERVTFEHSVPMYEQEVTRTASNMNQPSDALLHHCYTHCYLKISMMAYAAVRVSNFQNETQLFAKLRLRPFSSALALETQSAAEASVAGGVSLSDHQRTAAKALEVSHQQHGFLSVTYTQAVTRNVRHKLTARQERGSASQRLCEDGADGSPQHLHEILLTAQPFDLVLSCPLLLTVARVFRVSPPPQLRPPIRERVSAGQPMRGNSLSSSSLPLVYVNTSVIRVFCPLEDTHGGTHSQLKHRKEDTVVLKIGSVSVAPQADNPLPRSVLRKDIYQRALNLGVLRDPGSEVEDRQYQIDLQCINMGTAHWDDLRPEREGPAGGSPADGERSSQNPALEWNMASSIRRQQEKRVILSPIITDFSVRITAAPAVIYRKPLSADHGAAEEVVVCGHSLEMNVTSSLDLFLSAAQVQLLQQLLQANVGLTSADQTAADVCGHQLQSAAASGSVESLCGSSAPCGQDSGFGSDSARLRIVQIERQSGTGQHRLARPSQQPTITKNLSFIPFDVFLTAGRISLMTYATAPAAKTPADASPRPRKGSLDVPEDEAVRGGGLSSLTADDLLNANAAVGSTGILEGVSAPGRTSARQALGVTVVRQPGRRGDKDCDLQPLLFLQVTQPSILINCHHRKQRLELSLFDLMLKGVATDYKSLDAGKSLPEALDYSVFWLQTVAGEADSRTGIPPPLLSVVVRDFLTGPELKVDISRPVRVSPTLAKIEQAKIFWKRLFPEIESDLQPRTPAGSAPRCSDAPPTTELLLRSLQWPVPFHKISLRTVQMVVSVEMEAHAARPSLTLSVSATTGALTLKNAIRPADGFKEVCLSVQCEDVLVRTGLKDRSAVFAGPFSCSADLEAHWCRHSGSSAPDSPGPPRVLIDMKGGLLQVFWGQQQFNCLSEIQEQLQNYWNQISVMEAESNEKPLPSTPPHTPRPAQSEHSSDDLRTGLFQYIQDSACQKLPSPHEVVFWRETDDSPGVMLWRYPEPRVITFLRITPVPFNTTDDPDISTADLGDVLQVPCSLEFWDELQRAFVPYREFSLSESSVCELTLPTLTPDTHQTDLVTSDLWRVVLNSTSDGGDESSDSESGSQVPCDQLVCPTALAACTRVDSCFAPWFVPSVGVSIRLAYLELHFCHNLDQLGTAPCQKLRPFLPDRKSPQDQEFAVVCVREPCVFVRQWSDVMQCCRELSFSSALSCRLLEYRNLTYLPIVEPVSLRGHATHTLTRSRHTLHCDTTLQPLRAAAGQYAVHTLDRALQAWRQVPCSNGSLLHVWCTRILLEPNTHMQQRVVVFSPLFMMWSHLPDPVLVNVEKRSLGQRDTQLIQGRGHQEALLNVEEDLTHHLTFQAREEEDASQCAVPVSTAVIKQILSRAAPDQNQNQNQQDVLEHFYGEKTSSGPVWPYSSRQTDRCAVESVAQWDSPMQVRLSAWRGGLNTLLVELLPWALLVNRSRWDLWMFEAESIIVQIPAGKTIVPPNFKDAFQMGIYWPHTNTVHKSPAVRLVHEVSSPRWPEGGGADVLLLDEEGYIHTDITLGTQPGKLKLCQFCVSSSVKYGIQVLQIEDKTVLVNNTTNTIKCRAVISQHTATPEQPCPIPESSGFTLGPAGAAGDQVCCAVPCWDVLRDGQTAEDAQVSSKQLLLSLESAVAQWSAPALVRTDFLRQSVPVPVEPDADWPFNTRPLVLTCQEHLGVTYLTVNEDQCPRMLIHNRCPKSLLLKENIRESARSEVFSRMVPALSSVHHELFHQASSFPECRPKETLPTLQLRIITDTPTSPMDTPTTPGWTDPIDLSSPGTQVVFLPGFGCLYIDVLHQSGTITLTLAPESGAEDTVARHGPSDRMLSFRILLNEASVALCDDITSPSSSVELLRLTVSKLLLQLPPAEPSADHTDAPPVHTVQIHCGGLQVDNQLYERASFHFPVIVCQEPQGDPDLTPTPRRLQEFCDACFLSVSVTVTPDGRLDRLAFRVRPARVYLEDTFIYYMKTLFHTYIPECSLGGRSCGGGAEPVVPLEVLESSCALVTPVRLQKLSIEPVHLLVSIHASLKLYIASDHTPLSFSLFERGPVCTTPRQLVHTLAMHYAAGALFRAGWVVGSLEILGSPASLVRSIGNGVSDFFRLPYEGLTRGPGAFISGVSRGTNSFIKHISKGTLTSITNLATSLARNMDRLSLDDEHYMRQEEWRRQLPETLGDGLRQGLSRLGISLLGAIAGIVDQPMQTFTRTLELPNSASSAARGVISGVGKGIVGVFTKPIGGAAELVSQTGYGLLHGAGLWQLPKQLHLPTDTRSADASNSHVKYVWKMLQSLGRPELHMALDVRMVSGSGQEHAGCLLLSGEVLFVVSVCEDAQQQAFPITEIQCEHDTHTPGQITLTLQQHRVTSDTEVDGVRDRLSELQYSRLVDFVSGASQYLSPSLSSLHQHPTVTPAEPPPSVSKTYRYHADPAFTRVFVCKFNAVKNKALRIGFH